MLSIWPDFSKYKADLFNFDYLYIYGILNNNNYLLTSCTLPSNSSSKNNLKNIKVT